jgi:hypothetical protein
MKSFGSFGRRNYWACPYFERAVHLTDTSTGLQAEANYKIIPKDNIFKYFASVGPHPDLASGMQHEDPEMTSCAISIFSLRARKNGKDHTRRQKKEKIFSDYIGATGEAL